MKLRPIVSSFFFAALSPLSAQQASVPTISESASAEVIPEIIVVATRTERQTKDVAATTTVLDQKDSIFSLGTSMRDYQRYEPGLSLPFGVGGQGPGRNSRSGTQSINIRGLDGNRVLMQVDGIRQADLFTFGNTTSVGRDYLDVDALKRVEIVKGSASSLYGSDALGGVVSFVTKDPADIIGADGNNWGFESITRYQSMDASFGQTVAAAVRGGPVELMLLYTHRQGQEMDNRGNFAPDPMDWESHNWLTKLVWKPDERHTFKLTGEFFERTSENDLISSRRDVVSGPSTFRVRQLLLDDELTRYRLSLQHEFDARGLGWFFDRLDWSLYYQDSRTTEHIAENRDRVLPTPQDRFRVRDHLFSQNHLGGALNFVSEFETGGFKHQLSYGGEVIQSFSRRVRDAREFNYTTGTSTNVISPDTFPLKDMPDSTTLRAGLYLQDQITWGTNDRYTLTPGLRIDYYEMTTEADALYLRASGGIRPQDYDQIAIAPKLGFLTKLDEHHSAWFQYSMGFRNPTPEDLNATVTNIAFNYQTIPNPELQNEISHSFEIGLRGNYEKRSWSLAGFYNHYEDFIELFAGVGGTGAPGDPLIFQSRNLSRAEIYGIEFKGETSLDFLYPDLSGFSLFGNLGWQQGWDAENDQPLNSIDPLKFVTGMRYRRDKVMLELVSTYYAAQSRLADSTAQFETPSAFCVDLIGRWDISKNISLTAGIYNLTNQKFWLYQDVRGQAPTSPRLDQFTQPGIHGRVAMTVRF
jgi:hemoglobin/transferrin/lactoferrin receptor protein